MEGAARLAAYRRMLQALRAPLSTIRGVGPKNAEKLSRKGLATLGDALYFLPLRHEDRSRLLPLRDLVPGSSATFAGELLSLGVRGYARRRVLEGVLADPTGAVTLKWFRGNFGWLQERLKPGMHLVAHGPVSAFRGQIEVIHPDIETPGEGGEAETEAVTPVYSEVEGLHPRALRRIMRQAVSAAAPLAVNLVPPEAAAVSGTDASLWRDWGRTWSDLHFPPEGGEALAARVRACRRAVVLEEFFFLELALLLKKRGAEQYRGIAFRPDFRLIKPLLKSLPFELTGAQRKVLGEIRRDMEVPRPMHRLLQGDVGSGKTLVALCAALMAVESGRQAALMAPTEVLAAQHEANLRRFLGDLPVTVSLLTGSLPASEREARLAELAGGETDIAVGTHALIEPDVAFRSLGFVIVDEQHRFGVLQRAELASKGDHPDLLVMTATPIPRSLSMTVYGDLDLSVIDELPPGRTPVRTRVAPESRRAEVYDFVRREVAKGRQAFVVYPLVEESEKMELRAAVEMADSLAREVFPDLRVGLLHGRMRPDEKAREMAAFARGETQVCVCTTVIEVGIDIPNASVMVVEHAERFGLSQLHQLRGRVGRGAHASTCILLVGGPVGGDARRRLRVMEESEDGFRIAEEDLLIRGPGDLLGTRQAGLPDFHIGNIVRDGALLEVARLMAHVVLERDPALAAPEHEALREVVYERWAEKLALTQAG